jgi:hypothetical protein
MSDAAHDDFANAGDPTAAAKSAGAGKSAIADDSTSATPSDAHARAAKIPSADLEAELLDALREHFPGLEVVDRALELGPSADGRTARADLAALDACGRVVLVAFVDGGEETVIDALDAMALVRANRRAIAQHMRSLGDTSSRPLVRDPSSRPVVCDRSSRSGSRATSDLPPLYAIIAEAFAPRTVRALSAAAPRELLLFEVRELASRRGTLVTLEPAGDAAVSSGLGHAPPASAALVATAAALIDRIDTELERRDAHDSVVWRAGRRSLCSIAWSGEKLFGVVDDGNCASDLCREADIPVFLDRVLAAHLADLSHLDGAGASDVAGRDAADIDRPRGRNSEVLLTPEELAAFRD